MLRFSRLFRRSTLLTSGRRNRLELLITLNAHIVYNTWPSLSQRRGRRRRRQFMYYHKLSYEITVCYWLRYLLYSRQRTGAKTRRVLRVQKVMGAEYAVHHCLVLYSVFCSTIFCGSMFSKSPDFCLFVLYSGHATIQNGVVRRSDLSATNVWICKNVGEQIQTKRPSDDPFPRMHRDRNAR